jgi:Trk K+ transport system NAD-binding subunit
LSQPAAPEIIIFGATHVGITLANRLAEQQARVVLIDRLPRAPEPPRGWQYICHDFMPTPDVQQARTVYAVTDEDRLNIRIALAVRRAAKTLPVAITLVQSQLGRKLQRHLNHFSFVSPPELAAQKFVDAVYAPGPAPSANLQPPAAEMDAETSASWKMDPLVLRAIGAIVALAALAAVYFHFSERLSWIDSIYFVVTMMATVGFGDISLRSSTTLSKIIGIFLMIVSLTSTAVIFALITDSLLRHRLALSFGRRRVRQSEHVLVVGVGSVGLKVVEELLRRGERVVVIDEQANGRYMRAIYARRLPVVIGDAKLERTLRDAGLLRAKALLSVTSDDLTNLEVGLNAKLLNPGMRVVLRVYDQVLAQALHESLDIHFAFSTSAIAAGALAQLAAGAPED